MNDLRIKKKSYKTYQKILFDKIIKNIKRNSEAKN